MYSPRSVPDVRTDKPTRTYFIIGTESVYWCYQTIPRGCWTVNAICQPLRLTMSPLNARKITANIILTYVVVSRLDPVAAQSKA
jgi:hypothetical protein